MPNNAPPTIAAVAGSGVLTVHIPSLANWDIVSIRLDRWNPLPEAQD
jgi:hypothetical protein